MIKFFMSPKFDQFFGLVSMLGALWLKDTPLAVFGAVLYLGGIIEEGRGETR